jgi:hypothetical protein
MELEIIMLNLTKTNNNRFLPYVEFKEKTKGVKVKELSEIWKGKGGGKKGEIRK